MFEAGAGIGLVYRYHLALSPASVVNAIEAPGETHEIELKSLTYGFRGVEKRAFWTAPGEYTLAASLKTGVKPPPEGSQEGMDGFGIVTLKSEPIEFTVEGG